MVKPAVTPLGASKKQLLQLQKLLLQLLQVHCASNKQLFQLHKLLPQLLQMLIDLHC